MRFSSAVLVATFAFSAAALESNTVPTNQLTASMSVSPSSGGQAVISVDLSKVSAENGVLKEEPATLSSDESMVFSVNGQSVAYDPKDLSRNVLPLVDQGEYTLQFTRANGESYSSSVKLPAASTFTAPAPSAIFKKSEQVVAAWPQIQADGALLMIGSNCSPIAGEVNQDFTAMTFPADWTSNCKGPVGVQINMIVFNAGKGFGSFMGVAGTGIEFFYEGQTAAKIPRKWRTIKLN